MVDIVRASRKDISSLYGCKVNAFVEFTPEGNKTYLPFRAGTGLRLHELYHARSGRDLSVWSSSPYEEIREELESNKFSRSKRNKEDYVPGQVLDSAISTALDCDWSPGQVLDAAVRALRDEGYEVSTKGKSEIWRFIKSDSRKKHRRF